MRKNEKGSSLIFALVVISILITVVAACMAIAFSYYNRTIVANSDRQAYLTAKSVITNIVDNVVNGEDEYLKLIPSTEGSKNYEVSDDFIKLKMGTIDVLNIKKIEESEDMDKVTITVSATYGDRNKTIKADLQSLKGKNNWKLLKYYENKNIEEKIYTDKEEAIVTLLYESTWMSGLLFRNTVLKKINFMRYAEGKFPHSGAIFEYFGNNKSSIQYIYGPNWATILRPGKVSYASRILEVYAKGWTNLIKGLPLCYDYKLKLKLLTIRKNQGRDVLSNLILMSLRSQGQFNSAKLKEYYLYIKLYNSSPYIVLYIISIMPIKVLKFLRKKYAEVMKVSLMEQG